MGHLTCKTNFGEGGGGGSKWHVKLYINLATCT